MDLYDDVLAASSQPPESRTSSSEAPPEIRQEPSPKPNSKSPAILYTYSGLRNKRAAVYVGSFSWVSGIAAWLCLLVEGLSRPPVWAVWVSCGTYTDGGPPEKPLRGCRALWGCCSSTIHADPVSQARS